MSTHRGAHWASNGTDTVLTEYPIEAHTGPLTGWTRRSCARYRESQCKIQGMSIKDMKYCEGELGIMIRYCTDNGGDARGMRIRLKRMKPKLVVPPCWGHQVNLVVAEVLELEIPCMQSIDEG
ncbi:hypothetical protein B0H13DRAFT_2306449 [Mycena leptocephala]|nr:hypothetical protein B0H13DRAFT_2306449 [Mycena leptocephala]